MKFGFRIPSFKKRIAARTSWKRFVRHSLGFKAPRGFGWFTNPRKALYNRIYNRTTFDIFKLLGRVFSGGKQSANSSSSLFSLAISAIVWLLLIVVLIGFIGSLFSTHPKALSEHAPASTTPVPGPAPQEMALTPPTIVSVTKTLETPRSEPSHPAIVVATSLPPVHERFATPLEAQQAAIRIYPELGVAGSKLNTAFVARYRVYLKQHPEFFNDTSWPMRLAEEITRNSQLR